MKVARWISVSYLKLSFLSFSNFYGLSLSPLCMYYLKSHVWKWLPGVGLTQEFLNAGWTLDCGGGGAGVSRFNSL